MLSGCLLRSGLPIPYGSAEAMARSMPDYNVEVVGTILVGLAQPFFQCSPPLLSATWFGPTERALATATALNFNQVGIATAFIVGGIMANTPAGMHAYFDVVSLAAAVVAVATLLLFRDRPQTPPSASAAAMWATEAAEAAKREAEEGASRFKLSYPTKAAELLRNPGFGFALVPFVASIGCTNVVSAFTAPELARAGFAPGFGIDLAGAGFQIAIVAGGILLGRLVDETKKFREVTIACLGSSIVFLSLLGVSEGYDQSFAPAAVIAVLFALGSFAGPIQPIAAELAVEVTYPSDENAIEATQQLSGNLFSALLVPLCEWAASFDLQMGSSQQVDIRGDTLVLLALVSVTLAYFTAFDAPLKRTLLDSESEMVEAETVEAEVSSVPTLSVQSWYDQGLRIEASTTEAVGARSVSVVSVQSWYDQGLRLEVAADVAEVEEAEPAAPAAVVIAPGERGYKRQQAKRALKTLFGRQSEP